MNYLAHIYLSDSNEELMLGNFFGDFIQKKEFDLYPLKIQQGVRLHREIDSFTDMHPSFREMVQLLRPSLRKYAPVALDIIHDHILSTTWDSRNRQNLRSYCDSFYWNITNTNVQLPYRLKSKIQLMLKHDFLMSTVSLERLQLTLEHMDNRARFDSNFTKAIPIFIKHKMRFTESHKELMGDLKKMTSKKIEEFLDT